MLNTEIPFFVVFAPEVGIYIVAADGAVSSGIQNSFRSERGRCGRRTGAHALGQEKGQVTRQRLLHAVSRLVLENTKSGPDHRGRISQRPPGKSSSRTEAKILRLQQTGIESSLRGSYKGQRQQWQQCASRGGYLSLAVGSNDESLLLHING